MTERNSFEKDSNFKNSSGFSRIKFGIDRPILEVELNEMQKIQEEKITSVTKQLVPSGFLETKRRDFNGVDIVYNPIVTIRSKDSSGKEIVENKRILNSIAIPPARLMVNGYEVELEGKDEINGIKGYTVITLDDPPTLSENSNSNDFFDFLFLELWFEEVNSLSNIYKNGFIHGEILENSLIDSRVGDETSRRVSLRHRIRVEKDVNLKKWPNGFGKDLTSGQESRIYAQGPLNASVSDQNYIFLPATNSIFKGADFYNDYGLFVAGRKDYIDNTGISKINKQYGVLENYIFAIPMFGIKRRNGGGYSRLNPNGGITYVSDITVSDRPDGLFNNVIDKRDVIDLRKSISFGQVNTVKLLDDNLKKLMTGNLNTNVNDTMMRAQFGLPSIDTVELNALLHLDFTNRQLIPKLGSLNIGSIGDVNYHLSALGYGLSLDGKLEVTYQLDSFDKTKGTIEFLLKPYWDGADENINQTILTITNEDNLTIMKLVKEKNKLLFIQRHDGNPNTNSINTVVDLNEFAVYNNEIYHIRLTWESNSNVKRTVIYINGNRATVANNYSVSDLSPKFLKLGAIEDVNSYFPNFVGCLIDELVLYDIVLKEDEFKQFDFDLTLGASKVYNSFNGILTGFQDNEHKQSIITTILTSNGSNSFILESPYGTKVITENAKVYGMLSGEEYEGEWSINNDNAEFILVSAPDGSVNFIGETLWVTHEILVPGGLGIKDVPTKLLKAELDGKDVSFANSIIGKREISNLGKSGIETSKFIKIIDYKAYDYSSTIRNDGLGFARLVECNVESNGTNIYKIPGQLFGREVLSVKHIDRPLKTISKNSIGEYTVELIGELALNASFKIEIALGGFVFDYQTHTKSLISNMMKATTIKVQATGSKREYIIAASEAIGPELTNPNGGIISAFLNLSGQDVDKLPKDFGTVVYITGPQSNYRAEAVVEGVGTPFIKISFIDTPPTGNFIEIPVLITYQPKSSEILSVWYEHSPYQGVLTDKDEKKLKRLSDWKVFATTFGSGKIVTSNIKERSINNASNRLPGGKNYSYLLDGKDINFMSEQISVSGQYLANNKLVFKTQFIELIQNNDFDEFSNSLAGEFTVKKKYGMNYQDAFIESSISNIAFAIQDTIEPINKYLGAACLVMDEEGNILLFVMGEIIKNPTVQSHIRPIHGDLFKLEKNPIVISRND